MLLVQDQYGQSSRKNFDTELQLKQNTTKQVFSDTKETWEIESGCEEIITSGNDSAGEDILFADPSDLPEEIIDSKRHINPRKKNVRFGNLDYNYVFDTSETSSLENEYLGDECRHLEPGRRCSLTQDPEMTSCKVKNRYRVPHKIKWRPQECGYDKPDPEKVVGYLKGMEGRPKNVNEYDIRRMRRKEHHCGRHHCEDFDDFGYKKLPHRSFKFECGDDLAARCCDHWTEKKNYVKMKPMISAGHKHVCHMMDSDVDVKNHRKYRADVHCEHQGPCHMPDDRYCSEEFHDYPYSAKTKKKALEAVQEQQEQLSDSTYKVPCTKFSSQTLSGELSVFPRKKSSEKLINSSLSDWMYYSARGHSIGERTGPPRIHKMRSRRTRMNRIKNGWKKALVQTVRDGNRNERVGLIVMGSKGPEFYAKNSKNPMEVVPFRKSKSFLDGVAKSFEVMTVDCKNVFLSSSEPAPKTNYAINDLESLEDDEKVEEKIARFSKNVNEIVKSSEEKFYKSLSSSEYPQKRKTMEEMLKGAGEGVQEEDTKQDEKTDDAQKSTFSSLRLHPFETFSPRALISLRDQEKKFSEDSKAMADALNEQAKQYKENQSSLKGKEDTFLEKFKELKEKYLPKETRQDTVVPDLSLWGMKLEQLSEKNEVEQKEIEESSKKDDEEKMEEKEKAGKDERSQTGSVKSTEQISINKQRRKKYFESTTGVGKGDDEGDILRSKPHSRIGSPQRTGRKSKWESPFADNPEGADSNLISAVFRNMVENGCAISREESENLQSIFNRGSDKPEVCSNDVKSSCSSDVINTMRESKMNVSPRSPRTPTSFDGTKGRSKLTVREEKKGHTKRYCKERSENTEGREKGSGDSENFLEEVTSRKVLKMKSFFDEKVPDSKISKKVQGKSKKKIHLEDKMKLLRKALPSLAAENEAAHLKQLKKYIDRFIDRVEASTASEFSKRKEVRLKSKDSPSTNSSEVQVDAQKILDFVSNPFKKISSDVTINIAKKLTDALVQDKATKCQKNFSSIKARKHSENETDEDGLLPCGASSGSEPCEDPEPTYLKQLKKMRNEHLNNILLEVKRLSELLRFLDRCNRLHF